MKPIVTSVAGMDRYREYRDVQWLPEAMPWAGLGKPELDGFQPRGTGVGSDRQLRCSSTIFPQICQLSAIGLLPRLSKGRENHTVGSLSSSTSELTDRMAGRHISSVVPVPPDRAASNRHISSFGGNHYARRHAQHPR